MQELEKCKPKNNKERRAGNIQSLQDGDGKNQAGANERQHKKNTTGNTTSASLDAFDKWIDGLSDV